MTDLAGTAANAERPDGSIAVRPVLMGGAWRASRSVDAFRASDPRTRLPIGDAYPVSEWPDLDAALEAAADAAAELRRMPDAAAHLAAFLDNYAAAIESRVEPLVAAAAQETGLAAKPRLADVELPRTTGQLRQAAAAARAGDWRRPTIDSKAGLRSCLASVGPVLVIGPNNFPLAFNGIAGGDFASAIAAGNPVIAKAHPLHPTTSRLLAEAAHEAAAEAGLPAGAVQMVYHMAAHDGLRLVRDARLAAVAFTGGRRSGLELKAAADAAGKPFFGEMSSLNPTVLLPGALAERLDAIVDQWVASVVMGTGQFCTKPGLVLLIAGGQADAFLAAAAAKLEAAPAGSLFSGAGEQSIRSAIGTLKAAGAELVVSEQPPRPTTGFGIANTLLSARGSEFLRDPSAFQTELFGNAALVVVADDRAELLAVIRSLEGNLTGTIYSATNGGDDELYAAVAIELRPKVGRLINDKMPTGVAVSPAQHHGGPYPATSQPHFTAVGLPASILRFTRLESYDNVRDGRLPACLRDENPTGRLRRQIDGAWTRGDVGA